MKTQRNFLKAVVKQTISLGNIGKIGDFIDIAQKYVKTNIPTSLIKKYIAPALSFNTDNLETGSLPGTTQKCNGVWLFLANQTKTKSYFTKINNQLANIDELSEEDLSKIKIEILNGSGKAANLTKAKELLKNAGLNVTKVGNTNSTQKTSIIDKAGLSENILSSIQNLLGVGTTSSSDATSSVNITIILGKDFKG